MLSRGIKLFIAITFLSILTAYVFHILKPSRLSSGRLYIQNPQASALLSSAAKVSGSYNPYIEIDYLDTYLKFLNSNSFQDYGLKFLNENKQNKRFRYLEQHNVSPKDIMAKILIKKIDQDTIEISADDVDAHVAVAVANLGLQITKSAIISFESMELEQANLYLEQEIKRSKDRMMSINSQLAELSLQGATADQGIDSNSLDSRIGTLRSEYEKIKVSLSRNRLLTVQYTNEMRKLKQSHGTVGADGFRGQIMDDLQALPVEREQLEVNLKAIEARLNELAISRVSQKGLTANSLKRELDLEYSFVADLQRQVLNNSVQKISVQNKIRQVDSARVDSVRDKIPLRTKLIFAALAAFSFVCLMLIIRDTINPILVARSQLTDLGFEYLGHLPPYISNQHGLRKWFGLLRGRSLKEFLTVSLLSENQFTWAVRSIRNRLVNTTRESGAILPMSVGVLGAESGDGKSIFSAHLAIAFAASKRKTVLLDFDFFKSTVSDSFNCENKKGVSDLLQDNIGISECVHSFNDYLDVIPSGTMLDIDFENLNIEVVSTLIDALKIQYEVVVFDSLPFSIGLGAASIAAAVDLPIVVARENATSMAKLSNLAQSVFWNSKKPVLAVLNYHFIALDNSSPYEYLRPKSRQPDMGPAMKEGA